MEYDLHLIPNTREAEQKEYFPVVAHANTTDLDQLITEVAGRGTMRRAEVQYAVHEFLDVVAKALKRGDNVSIEGLGRLKVSLGCQEPITSTRTPREGKIQVKNVNFWPEKELVKFLNKGASFKRTTRVTQKMTTSAEDLKIKLKTVWFKDHTFITRKDLERFAILTTSTAKNRINELIAMNFLKRSEMSNSVYVLVKPSQR